MCILSSLDFDSRLTHVGLINSGPTEVIPRSMHVAPLPALISYANDASEVYRNKWSLNYGTTSNCTLSIYKREELSVFVLLL